MLALAIVGAPRIITAFCNATVLPGKDQSIGAIVKLGLTADTLPITVTIDFIANHTSFHLARILLVALQLLSGRHVHCKIENKTKKKRDVKLIVTVASRMMKDREREREKER